MFRKRGDGLPPQNKFWGIRPNDFMILSGKAETVMSQVYNYIRDVGEACDMDISKDIDLPINSAVARRNELVDLGLIEFVKNDSSPYTGRKVYFWRVTQIGR